MNRLFFLLIFLKIGILSAQNSEALPPEQEDVYFQNVYNHVDIPQELLQTIEDSKLTLKISMSVNADGSLGNIRIAEDVHKLLPYVEKAILAQPNWVPKMVDGKAIYSKKKFTLILPNEFFADRAATAPFTLAEFYKEFSNKMNLIYDFRILDHEVKRFSVNIDFDVDPEGNVQKIKVSPHPTSKGLKRIHAIFDSFGKWQPKIEDGKRIMSHEKISIPISVNIPVS